MPNLHEKILTTLKKEVRPKYKKKWRQLLRGKCLDSDWCHHKFFFFNIYKVSISEFTVIRDRKINGRRYFAPKSVSKSRDIMHWGGCLAFKFHPDKPAVQPTDEHESLYVVPANILVLYVSKNKW